MPPPHSFKDARDIGTSHVRLDPRLCETRLRGERARRARDEENRSHVQIDGVLGGLRETRQGCPGDGGRGHDAPSHPGDTRPIPSTQRAGPHETRSPLEALAHRSVCTSRRGSVCSV